MPDVIALQRRASSEPPTGGAVVTAVPPRTRMVYHAEKEMSLARANRVAIRHPLGRVVSVIELISPGNKDSRRALQAFVGKSISFLQQGIHLLVIDLFPPSVRDPNGIHPLIWDEFQEEPFVLPKDKPLTLASYVAGFPKTAYVELVAAGDPLPAMPAYLDDDSYVPVPLEATYEATWQTCPEEMRNLVERGVFE